MFLKKEVVVFFMTVVFVLNKKRVRVLKKALFLFIWLLFFTNMQAMPMPGETRTRQCGTFLRHIVNR